MQVHCKPAIVEIENKYLPWLAGELELDREVAESYKKGEFFHGPPDPELMKELVIDGAHNAHAIEHLAITWRQQFPGQQATLLLGVVADKDIDPMLAALQPIARRWIASQPPPPRGLPADELADRIRRLTGPDALIEIHPTPSEALRQAMATNTPILATGSLFFAAEILARMKNQPIHRPSSAQ